MRHLFLLSDTDLIHLFATGDDRAFQVLYNRYQQNIFNVVVYYVKAKTLAEDIMQEVSIKIIQSIKANRYCEEGKFLPWALRIARNLCMDYLRKSPHVKYVEELGGLASAQVTTSTPQTQMETIQRATLLYSFIEKLPEEQQKVLYYRHFEELSFKEIAKLTNTSVNTSLGRMRYALMHLRNMTQNHSTFH